MASCSTTSTFSHPPYQRRPGITLGVLVREAGALRFHHGAAGEVFRRDEFDVLELPLVLVLDGGEDVGVHFGERFARRRTAVRLDLLHAARVASAFELRAEEGLDDRGRPGWARR